jgi:CHASE3 domain sensor protein
VTIDATRRRAIGQILLLSAGFFVLVAISALSVVLVTQSRKDNRWVVHTIEVENQVNALLLDIRRAESAVRGYMLSSAPQFLTEQETAVAAIRPELDRLTVLTADNPVRSKIL